MPVGYAVVGLGKFTERTVLTALQKTKDSKLVALVSGDLGKAKRLADEYDGVPVYSYDGYGQMLQNRDVDAVYIVLPNSMHWKYTIDAANGGKHVLCEKPMAVTPAECLNMIEVCRKNSVKLMVGYRVHFDPGNHEAIKLIRDGAIGKPKFVQAAFSQCTAEPGQWRLNYDLAGGGALVDVGIYCINACRYLLDCEPEAVVGMVSSTADIFSDVEENAMAIFRFPNQVLASITCSYGTERVDGFTVDGSKGWIRLDNAFSSRSVKELTLSRENELETRVFDPGDQVAAEIDYFSQCIEANIEPQPNGEEGMRDVIAFQAVYRSAKNGCCVPVNYEAVAKAA